jgi:hypothetical protein
MCLYMMGVTVSVTTENMKEKAIYQDSSITFLRQDQRRVRWKYIDIQSWSLKSRWVCKICDCIEIHATRNEGDVSIVT